MLKDRLFPSDEQVKNDITQVTNKLKDERSSNDNKDPYNADLNIIRVKIKYLHRGSPQDLAPVYSIPPHSAWETIIDL